MDVQIFTSNELIQLRKPSRSSRSRSDEEKQEAKAGKRARPPHLRFDSFQLVKVSLGHEKSERSAVESADQTSGFPSSSSSPPSAARLPQSHLTYLLGQVRIEASNFKSPLVALQGEIN